MFDLVVSVLTVFAALWFLTPLRHWSVIVLTEVYRLVRGLKMPRWGQSQGVDPQFRAFVDLLDVPTAHTNIVGATGDGKSVLARAIMAYRATINPTAQFCIIDPHFKYGSWPSDLVVYGKGRNYDEISSVLQALLTELSNRYEQYASSDTEFSELNIFVDEVPAIAGHCKKEWSEFVSQISSEGRKVQIRLVTMSQSKLVELFGIKGKSDLLRNFTEMALGEFVPDAIRGSDIKVPGNWQHPVISVKRGQASLHNGYGLHTISLPAMQSYVAAVQPTNDGKSAASQGGNPNEFTTEHVVKAMYYLTSNKGCSARSLARHMGWGDGKGSHNQKAQRLMAYVAELQRKAKSGQL